MRINLRRRNRAMPEKLLDRAEVGPAFKQMRGKAVTQHVWVDMSKTGAACGGVQDAADRAGGNRDFTRLASVSRFWTTNGRLLRGGQRGDILLRDARRFFASCDLRIGADGLPAKHSAGCSA